MPAPASYPGVYIEEVPSGVRTITGVPTSITAFIGRARRGPTDRPGRVQNFADFERMYGGLWEISTLGYAVQHFFANSGTDALIVRVVNGAAPATLALAPFHLVAANEGDWGERLRIRVNHDTRNPADTTLFNLAVRDMATSETEHFLDLSTDPNDARIVTRVLELESRLLRVSGAVDAIHPPANAPLASPGDDPFVNTTSTGFNSDGADGADITPDEIISPELEAAHAASGCSSRRTSSICSVFRHSRAMRPAKSPSPSGMPPRPIATIVARYCSSIRRRAGTSPPTFSEAMRRSARS